MERIGAPATAGPGRTDAGWSVASSLEDLTGYRRDLFLFQHYDA